NHRSLGTTNAQRVADLAIVKTAPATASAGTDITYTLTVTNNGPSASSGGTVTDVLPAQVSFVSASAGCANTASTVTCNFGTLAPSATQLFTIVVHINPAATGPIANTATVAASNPAEDTNAGNNSSMATTTAQRVADLSIAKSAPATATSGTDITYSLTVTNNGPSTSSGGTVTDVLPAQVSLVSASAGCTNTAGTVSCSVGALALSATQTFTIVVHISPAATGPIANTATVTATNSLEDTSAANNAAVATTTAQRVADLSIAKSAPATATSGTDITYSLTVTNNGPSTSSGGTVTDVLPAQVTLVSAS